MSGVVTRVLLIRHAERDAPQTLDPPLNAAGRTRAQALIHVAGDAAIAAIYISEYVRSRQTAEPLAARLGLVPIQWPADDTAGLVAHLLAHHAGKAVLVVGHTDTIPAIITELCGQSVAQIGEAEFDNLYVATRCGPTRGGVVRLRYGRRT